MEIALPKETQARMPVFAHLVQITDFVACIISHKFILIFIVERVETALHPLERLSCL